MSCIPVSNNVLISFHAVAFVMIKAEIFYSVFARNTLVSATTINMKPANIKSQWLFVFPKMKRKLYIFEMRTDPTKIIKTQNKCDGW